MNTRSRMKYLKKDVLARIYIHTSTINSIMIMVIAEHIPSFL